MASRKSTKGKKTLKRGKKVGAVKSLRVGGGGVRRPGGGGIFLNPQPLPP